MTHSAPPRTLGYYARSRWFQGGVVLVLVGLLAFTLLSALSDAEERAERQMVELTVRNMRTGMWFATGEALMRQGKGEMTAWVGGNPIQWLASLPSGYRGECSAEERRGMSGGEWCFEKDSHELVYRPRNAEHLRSTPGKDGRQCDQLSWRVARVPGSAASTGGIGLRIEAASPCGWSLKGA